MLDGQTGSYLCGSDDEYGAELTLTPNILAAMNGRVGQDNEILGSYFDVAIPIRGDGGETRFIVMTRASSRSSTGICSPF